MKNLVVKYSLFCLLLFVPLAASGQKDVRKNVRKGNRAYNQQKIDDAYKFYDKAMQENPGSKEAVFNIGNTLYRQKQWDKSVEQMQHYLSLEQEDPLKMSAAWHNIGNAMLQKKELQKSMEAYKMALRLNSQDDEARYNLAVVKKMIQDNQQQQNQNQNEQQQQEQNQDQQNQDQQNQQQRPEEPKEPEQMSRSNAQQILQAIEQDERKTQEKVQKIQAEERKKQAEENRRRNKNW